MEEKILEVLEKEKEDQTSIKDYIKNFIESEKIQEEFKDNELFKSINNKNNKEEFVD